MRLATLALLSLALPLPAVAATPGGLDSIQRLTSATGLDRPEQLVVTRDGSRIFVLDRDSDVDFIRDSGAVATFAVDDQGAVQFVGSALAGVGDLEGILDPVSIALSPDERFLYLGAHVIAHEARPTQPTVPAIVTFEIGEDGSLSFRSFVRTDLFYLSPLLLVPSPDGRHLYAVASAQNGGESYLATFARDQATGALSLVDDQSVEALLQGVAYSPRVSSMVVSPDGRNAYFVSHSVPEVIEAVISTFDRDPQTGTLTAARFLPPASRSPILSTVHTLMATDDGGRLYAQVGNGDERLLAFHRDLTTGDLTGAKVLSAPSDTPDAERPATIDRTGQFFYQCLDDATLQVLEIDRQQGTLAPVETVALEVTGTAPTCGRPVATGDGRSLLMIGLDPYRDFDAGALTRFRRDPETGRLDGTQTLQNHDGGLQGLDTLGPALVSSDGRHVYAFHRNGEILVFSRDTAQSGQLDPRPEETLALADGFDPQQTAPVMAGSPDGRSLYLGFTDSVITLSRDPASGSLRQVNEISPGAVALTVSEDGRFVYSRETGPEVTAFERNPRTGALSPVQTLALPSGGPGARNGIALGPEQQSLYTTSSRAPSALSVLTRDRSTGRMELIDEILGDGSRGFEAYAIGSVVVSPDGRQVYATGLSDARPEPQILTFDRSPESGTLSTPPTATWSALSLAIAPDGQTVYAITGDYGQTLADLTRNPLSGRLTDRHTHFVQHDYTSGPPAVSPDGANVYVSGYQGLSVFTSRWLTSVEAPDFRFQVSIDTGKPSPLAGKPADECPPGTVCARGAVPGRTEALMRIVGPKPNGRLWPTVVKFSTSALDVDIAQLSTGEARSYHLAGATPGSDSLAGLFDREGFVPTPDSTAVRWIESAPAEEGEEGPAPPAGPVFTSPDFPGFRFQARLTNSEGAEPSLRAESACFEETLCLSGAVPGRSELFLRLVGPKPNGRLWPTIVRTTTSTVEVWIEQVSTGQVNYYRLEGASPDSTDLSGLFDREGFTPDH